MGLPWWLSGKEFCNVGDTGSIPGLGGFPRGGHGNPLQYSCLENPMDRGPWKATVHRVAKSRTELSDRTHIGLHRSLKGSLETICTFFQGGNTVQISKFRLSINV